MRETSPAPAFCSDPEAGDRTAAGAARRRLSRPRPRSFTPLCERLGASMNNLHSSNSAVRALWRSRAHRLGDPAASEDRPHRLPLIQPRRRRPSRPPRTSRAMVSCGAETPRLVQLWLELTWISGSRTLHLGSGVVRVSSFGATKSTRKDAGSAALAFQVGGHSGEEQADGRARTP